jgi:hypothetical protein
VGVVVVVIVFAVTLLVVLLRFSTVLRQMADNMRLDKAEYAARLDAARAGAFTDAMTALEAVQERVAASQTELLARTMDVMAGPQGESAPADQYRVDNPNLDARPVWQPDDEWDYTGLGIDPTDETLPMPRLEPEGNEARAVMVPPGEGLLPQ